MTTFAVAAGLEDAHQVHLPSVYNGSGLTLTPTSTLAPLPTGPPSGTPAATPVGEWPFDWVYIVTAGNAGAETWIMGLVPSYCHELRGQKSVKTIYVWTEFLSHEDCIVKGLNPDAPYPPVLCNQDFSNFPCACPPQPEYPPPWGCGEVEKLDFTANSKTVCSLTVNCVDSK